tara:strand:+ start:1864 stop:2052 length:189 start_codon:yes stop_codon:yes gene_type:complete
MLKEIGNALLASDVSVKQVLTLRSNISKKVNLEEMGARDRRKLIQQVRFISSFSCLLSMIVF